MIVFNLTCDKNHSFEGWFSSAGDYEKQNKKGQISCPRCGSNSIVRSISAPYVNTKTKPPKNNKEDGKSAALQEAIQFIEKKMIDHVIKSTEDVGSDFPEEARKIYYKEKPQRSIRGNASKSDVEELQNEGIDVIPLPDLFAPPETPH